MEPESRCRGCGDLFPDAAQSGAAAPTHPYILSSPGCWQAYGELLAREYQDPRYMRVHRLTVDAYAVQHPGVDTPQARNSVGIHLSRLLLLFERVWPMERINASMVSITAKKHEYPWLIPRHSGTSHGAPPSRRCYTGRTRRSRRAMGAIRLGSMVPASPCGPQMVRSNSDWLDMSFRLQRIGVAIKSSY